MSTTLRVFVSCLPRLEVLLHQEVEAILGARKLDRKRGGIEMRVSFEELWRLSHDLRVAESIRVRIGSFSAPNFDAFSQGLARLPWSVYFGRDAVPPIEVASAKSALYHDQAVAERAHAFFVARGGVTEDSNLPTVHIRIVNDAAVVSIEASGEGLHRRGLRPAVLRAPLRETYAAACLRIAGLDTSPSLADPVCGTGVFLSERAAMQGGFLLPRRFAFEGWVSHVAEDYAQWCAGRGAPSWPNGLRLRGGDKSSAAIEAARRNMALWDAGDALSLEQGDARDFLASLPDDADVIANPPWGQRLQGASAVGGVFGRWLRDRSPNATGKVVVLVAGHEFLRATGVRWRELLAFRDGGTNVRLLGYEAPPARATSKN